MPCCSAGCFCFYQLFPVAFGTIAWTGYAERYVYISAAFWSVVVCHYAAEKMKEMQISVRYQFAGVVLFMVCLGMATFQRNVVWNTNLALYADTVEKNPICIAARIQYMVALAKEKNYSEAIRQYKAASSIITINYYEDLGPEYGKYTGCAGKA